MGSRKTLLFDLGGVIVRWVGIEALMKMSGLSRKAVVDILVSDPLFYAYETGRCNDDEFISALINTWNLGLTSTEAKLLWQSWVQPAYPGTEAALKTLRKSYRVACLSNTNALHWKRLDALIHTDDLFHHAYASHILGAAKPDVTCYELALKNMGAEPQDVIFFDDTQANIDTANALGMQAHLVDRSVGVIPVLRQLNLL